MILKDIAIKIKRQPFFIFIKSKYKKFKFFLFLIFENINLN